MSFSKSVSLFSRPLGMLAAACAVAGLCGCAAMCFKPIRESQFINMDAERVQVEYGEEKRTETMPNGLVCTFDGKVRVVLPDGKRIVLYQAFTAAGVRYVSEDKRYEFYEKGPYCIVRHRGATIFEGVFCHK